MAQRKITFNIVQDADGYPPFASESVWASSTENPYEYVVDNIPFFAREATLGDRIRARQIGNELVFETIVQKSSNSLVRVVVYDPSQVDAVRAQLKALGCTTEAFGPRPIIAVDIPARVDLARVRNYLDPLETNDVLTYEEPLLRHP